MNATVTRPTDSKIVSKDQWLAARRKLLEKEKELTRLRDDLTEQRRELPWEKIEKNYLFDGPDGKQTLADLFNGRSQLIIYHFMFGPEWEEGCPGCSYMADNFDGSVIHLSQRDVTMLAVSRTPYSKIEAFKKRMGWQFKWVSSSGNDFNRDYRVSFSKEEMVGGKIYNFGTSQFPSEEAPGASVFFKDDAGNVFHTYSIYGRGLEDFLSTYRYLDITPKGRDEDSLPRPMAWLRHHDRYEQSAPGGGGAVQANVCCTKT